ncbi:MAG: hypothetical protein HY595_06130 [Candidatus Omnitrophica bacterium]|nr:hypothetical protein [Candidatus Omnitrophota bacterium]
MGLSIAIVAGAILHVIPALTPQGVRLVSDDGKATLTIPPGALPNGLSRQAVRMVPVVMSARPDLAQYPTAHLAYRLEPDGIVLNKPAILRIEASTAPHSVPMLAHVSARSVELVSGATIELIEPQRVVVTGALSHFSLVELEEGLFTVEIPDDLGTHRVGETFPVSISVESRRATPPTRNHLDPQARYDDRNPRYGYVFYVDGIPTVSWSMSSRGPVIPQEWSSRGGSDVAPGGAQVSSALTCINEGPGHVMVSVALRYLYTWSLYDFNDFLAIGRGVGHVLDWFSPMEPQSGMAWLQRNIPLRCVGDPLAELSSSTSCGGVWRVRGRALQDIVDTLAELEAFVYGVGYVPLTLDRSTGEFVGEREIPPGTYKFMLMGKAVKPQDVELQDTFVLREGTFTIEPCPVMRHTQVDVQTECGGTLIMNGTLVGDLRRISEVIVVLNEQLKGKAVWNGAVGEFHLIWDLAPGEYDDTVEVRTTDGQTLVVERGHFIIRPCPPETGGSRRRRRVPDAPRDSRPDRTTTTSTTSDVWRRQPVGNWTEPPTSGWRLPPDLGMPDSSRTPPGTRDTTGQSPPTETPTPPGSDGAQPIAPQPPGTPPQPPDTGSQIPPAPPTTGPSQPLTPGATDDASQAKFCCESCPGTHWDRFYFPILPDTDCRPGDVRREDLPYPQCPGNLFTEEPGPPTYGEACCKGKKDQVLYDSAKSGSVNSEVGSALRAACEEDPCAGKAEAKAGAPMRLETSVLSTGSDVHGRNWVPENPMLRVGKERLKPCQTEPFYATKEATTNAAAVVLAAISDDYADDAKAAEASKGASCHASGGDREAKRDSPQERAAKAAAIGLLASQAKGQIEGLRATFDVTGKEDRLQNAVLEADVVNEVTQRRERLRVPVTFETAPSPEP